jgi:LysM repeat protein
MAMQTHPKAAGTKLIVFVSLFIAASVAIEVFVSRLRLTKPAASTSFDLDTPVLPPNLARDPFIAAAPKPAPIVAPRPSVKGEALIAGLAIGAYIAVFGASVFGGNNVPDLLSIRSDGNNSPALAADVLGAQEAPPASAVAIVDAVPTETAAPEPAPTEVPTPEPMPERPTQHTLRSGETLTSVAALYGLTAYDLTVANGLASDRVLAGQVLRIPPQ